MTLYCQSADSLHVHDAIPLLQHRHSLFDLYSFRIAQFLVSYQLRHAEYGTPDYVPIINQICHLGRKQSCALVDAITDNNLATWMATSALLRLY